MVTQQHREIWTITYQTDTLNRIFDSKADIVIEPVSEQEFTFVNMIFLHMSSCFELSEAKVFDLPIGIKADLKDILSYPIPNYVWLNVYKFYDYDFVQFVMHNRKFDS